MTFDIETDGLLPTMTKIHCIVIDDVLYDTPHGIAQAVARLEQHTGTLVGHNIIGFDLPAIRKIFPLFRTKAELLDTKVWAQLAVPDVLGLTMDNTNGWKRSCPQHLWNSQSLRAWGYRLGVLKGTTPDETWAEYTPEMGRYCLQDVVVTKALHAELLRWTTSPLAVQTEMDVAKIIQRQIEFGVKFNVEAAHDLQVKLADEVRTLGLKLADMFPPWKKLERSFVPKRDNKKFGHVAGQLYHKYKTVEFNPGSNHHLVEKLGERYGWEPTVFTDKGNPQMDERVLADLAKLFPAEVEPIVQWRTANKIATFISGSDGSWLNHVGADGRIHGNVNSCGAGTRRMTHNSPNLGQVPSSRAYLGKECRALFGPPNGFTLVGVDADQLELRGLAHFLGPYDSGAYIHAACHGSKDNKTDIHWRNAKAVGIDRDSVKTVFYAYIYGAGLAELGSNITKGWDTKANILAGRRVKAKLERGIPAIVKLKETILEARKSRGYLYDLQGQMFRLRSDHSALNEVNQRAGAIIMKVAQVMLDEELKRCGLEPGQDYEFMLTVHDEWQLAVKPWHAELVAKSATDAIAAAQGVLKFRCPLKGSASIGKTWADTH